MIYKKETMLPDNKNFPENMQSKNRESVYSYIIDLITKYLLEGKLKPGDKLPSEAEFALQLGVARNSVREAMKMLSALGIIEIRRGVGTFIAESISSSMLSPLLLGLIFEQDVSMDIVEFRLLIDTSTAELAIQKAGKEDIERLEMANRMLEEKVKNNHHGSKKLKDLDLNFHRTLLEITGNKLLGRVGMTIYTLFLASIEKTVEEDPMRAVRNHKMVIDAIKKRDSNLVKEIMRESLSFWMESIREK